jgi:hypothetical protein
MLGYSVIECVGYQQLHDVWRAIGYVDIGRGTTGWSTQRRRGFATEADTDSGRERNPSSP